MGGQKIHDPRTKCHLWLYKSGDCDGSEASKKMGKLQKPFKKIKMTGDETRVATVGDEEFGSMLVDCKVNDLDKLSF